MVVVTNNTFLYKDVTMPLKIVSVECVQKGGVRIANIFKTAQNKLSTGNF